MGMEILAKKPQRKDNTSHGEITTFQPCLIILWLKNMCFFRPFLKGIHHHESPGYVLATANMFILFIFWNSIQDAQAHVEYATKKVFLFLNFVI